MSVPELQGWGERCRPDSRHQPRGDEASEAHATPRTCHRGTVSRLGDLPLRAASYLVQNAEDAQAMALRNAYAIDMLAPDTLTRRRERIAGIHGLSIDTSRSTCTSAT